MVAQLRDVHGTAGELLGSGPKTLHVREAEGTVRIPATDLERLLPGVDQLRIETIDDEALERAVEDGGDASLVEIDPDPAVRLAGTAQVLGQEDEVSVIAVLQLARRPGPDRAARHPARRRRCPRCPPVVQRTLSRLFTVRVDPGSLPLQVTPTALRASAARWRSPARPPTSSSMGAPGGDRPLSVPVLTCWQPCRDVNVAHGPALGRS